MKKIEAIIKPFKLEEVKDALNQAGIDGMTISEVKGLGRQNRHTEIYRGSVSSVDFLPKIKIEMVLPDNRLDKAVAAIMKGVNPSAPGDDKILVSNIEDLLPAYAEKCLPA
jgi:nitrogen regulatory protein P-II 1